MASTKNESQSSTGASCVQGYLAYKMLWCILNEILYLALWATPAHSRLFVFLDFRWLDSPCVGAKTAADNATIHQELPDSPGSYAKCFGGFGHRKVQKFRLDHSIPRQDRN